MKIKILGTGEAKSQQLEKTIRTSIEDIGIDAEIEEVKDIDSIMEYPIIAPPGLVIDEELVCSGRTPSKVEVHGFLLTALARE